MYDVDGHRDSSTAISARQTWLLAVIFWMCRNQNRDQFRGGGLGVGVGAEGLGDNVRGFYF